MSSLRGSTPTRPGLTQLDLAAPAFPGQPLLRQAYAYALGDHRLASATAIRDPNGGAPDVIQNLAYTHDTAGNLRRSDDLMGLLGQRPTYDALHRIESVAATGTQGAWVHGYSYDAAGNLLFKGPPGAAGELALLYNRSATTPARLASVDRNLGGDQWTQNAGLYLVNADGGVTARTKDGALTTLWRNAEGSAQVVTNHATAQVATYHYDPSGERSEKLVTGVYGVVPEARYAVDATFEVDTVNDTHEVHVFVGSRRVATSKRTGLGNGNPSGAVSQVTFYHPDQVGTNSVTSIVSASGHSVSRAYLDPFGDKQAGSGEPRHLFTDQERDAETGLDYFGARYYDAWVGRFLEQDPELIGRGSAVFRAIRTDTHYGNPYSYALNRPTAVIDPTGRIPWWALGASVAFDDGGGSSTSESGASQRSESRYSQQNSLAVKGNAKEATGSNNSNGSGDRDLDGIETIEVKGTRLAVAATSGFVFAIPLIDGLAKAIIVAGNILLTGATLDAVQEFISQQSENGDESSYTDKPGKIAEEVGKTVKEVKDAIHRVKEGVGRNTEIRNPEVKVDPKSGDVRPIGPDGSLGDSIGNIFDFL